MPTDCSTWLDWERFIRFHLRRLSPYEPGRVFAPTKTYAEFKTGLSDWQDRHSRMIDRAVRKFASNNRWPPLDRCQKYFLKRRLECARRLCLDAHSSQPLPLLKLPAPASPLPEIFRALVIDGWKLCGIDRWRSNLHGEWLHVLAWKIPKEELNKVLQDVQSHRIVSMIAHRVLEPKTETPELTFKHFDYYIQCANGTRWTGREVSVEPATIEHIQTLFRNSPEIFIQLATG